MAGNVNSVQHSQCIVFVRQRDHATKVPVLLFLNGAGENGDDGYRQISNNFGVQVWEMRGYFPFLAVAPQCRVEGSWSPGSPDSIRALEALDRVIEEYGGDPDRVFLTGVSSGGNGTWMLAAAESGRFAGVIPMCGQGGADARRLAEAGVPVWNFYNERDTADIVRFNESVRRQLLELGQSPLSTTYDALGHDCWNRGYRTTALFAWMAEQSRSRNRARGRFELMRPARLLESWRVADGEEGEAAGWSADGEAIVAASSAVTLGDDALVGPGSGWLISDRESNGIEFHADVWVPAGGEARLGLSARPSIASNGTGEGPAIGGEAAARTFRVAVSLVTAELGTGGIVTGGSSSDDGQWLAPLDSGAQRTIRRDAWNDVRLELYAGRLSVSINGWPAAEAVVDAGGEGSPMRFAPALVPCRGGAMSKWRHVRIRSEAERD
ncbi:MAG: family 16 glycoside hydrolase [Planctomycetales bacterium]